MIDIVFFGIHCTDIPYSYSSIPSLILIELYNINILYYKIDGG